jgi:hypothetical protein
MFRAVQKPTRNTELRNFLTTPDASQLWEVSRSWNLHLTCTDIQQTKTITLVKESEVLTTFPAHCTLLNITVLTILRNLLMNHWNSLSLFLFCGAVIPFRVVASPYRLRDHTLRHATLGRTPVDGDQHDPDTSTLQHTLKKRQISIPRWKWNPQSQQASGRSPMP